LIKFNRSIGQNCEIIDDLGKLPNIVRYTLKDISPTNIMIITDSTVHSHYHKRLDDALPEKYSVDWIVLNPGEDSKLFTNILSLSEKILKLRIDRNSLLIGFGGGVITDITGFVASILLRGVRWIAIPTTVIGMTDAAIGGKTGANTESGKNLVGTFYPPEHIFVFPDFLKTLSDRDITAGWSEIIKYRLLEGGDLWNKFGKQNLTTTPTSDIIEHCIRYKERVVQEDPFENGLRRQLNLGHTAGHALEVATAYKVYNHGEAVLWGLGVMLQLSHLNCGLPEDVTNLAQQLISKFILPESNVHPDTIVSHLASDKKRINNKNIWVLLNALGKFNFYDQVPEKLIYDVITKQLEFLKVGKAVR